MKVVEAMKVADPAEGEDVDMGPVISADQQERVLGFLERAADAKATIVTGGGAVGDKGFFVSPAIVTDVEQDAEIVQREVFGPVVTMQRFSSDEDAIAMANGFRYGLAASVFSENVGRALSAAARARLRDRVDQRAPVPAHLRRCRTAASRSRATERTCRSTRWRSTPASSTSP